MPRPADPKVYAGRRAILRSLLSAHGLDVILAYASNKQSSYVQWATGSKPLLFHYYYVTASESGFLEIDYLTESLREQTDEHVTPIIEDLIEHELPKFLKPFKAVGIIGNAPYPHLRNVRQPMTVLNDELHVHLLPKSDREIAGLAASAKVAKRALQNAAKWIKTGMTEKQLAEKLRSDILSDAEDLSFPMGVTTGPRIKDTTASFPTARKIAAKDIVCIDLGSIKDGFASDSTRMYFRKDDEAEENYLALCDAHKAVIKRMTPDLPIREIPVFYAEEMAKRGLPAETLAVGDLGHSIGFEVHEFPFLYRKEYDKYSIVDRMVYTLEPEIVFSRYRLRVEDMIAMIDGKPVVLT